MFDRIFVANRGEIAMRILRSCRAMGIGTATAYADPDQEALAVGMADQAEALVGITAAETYLDMGKIIAAAKRTGADAVHPGYGFLSENAEFAAACEAEGLVFIGPPPSVIGDMGDKLTAKAIAANAGVTIIPGGDVALTDENMATKVAGEIGFPVMLKAAAGGGGKGMRVVWDEPGLAEAYGSAVREAQAAFGDGRVFVEKFIENPRHIEIQILADAHGNVVHLGERECSIQRRHQKIIEEAPSPLLDAETRGLMGDQAVDLARAVGYRSAGTVEFVADQQRNFYFLEMNTRLQVEHPVTEAVTGLDLVEWMIRIAAGEKLDFAQNDVHMDGWAMEARVYAEDPVRGFLPSTGRLVRYREPEQINSDLRVDTGVCEGDEIGVQYDPMIAKLIVHGVDRQAAAANLASALDQYVIHGLNHNIGFLQAVARHPRFVAGDLSTDFIQTEWPEGFAPTVPQGDAYRHLAAAALFITLREGRHDVGGLWVVVRAGGHGDQYKLEAAPIEGGFRVSEIDHNAAVDFLCDWRPADPRLEAKVDGGEISISVERAGLDIRLRHGGFDLTFHVLPLRLAPLLARMPEKIAADTGKFVIAPMPGLLISLGVVVGQEVKSGEAMAIIEAMKMENILRAERDGVVAKLHVAVGDSLRVDQQIIEFE